MAVPDFKYDVAFSFTQQDENLAHSLFSLLKDRLHCFIYSEEQKKLAGGDGEVLFNNVYGKESRIVVILFRNEYGSTKWTRIEQTAIRNRGYEDGYDFVILIPTVKNSTAPAWLPKNRLWIGLERWGIESAAGVIEARVQEFGGVPKTETIAQRTAKREEQENAKRERENLLDSPQSLSLAHKELDNLKKILKTHQEEITNNTGSWIIKYQENKDLGVDVFSYGYFLTIRFYQQYANSLKDTWLSVKLLKGYFDENGRSTIPFEQTMQIDSATLQFDLNTFNQQGWSIRDSRKNFQTSEQLAEHWVAKLMLYAEKGRYSSD